jgi:hypothetical protein
MTVTDKQPATRLGGTSSFPAALTMAEESAAAKQTATGALPESARCGCHAKRRAVYLRAG